MRNELIARIIIANGGTVTDPDNLNTLLADWLTSLGG